MPDGLDVTVPLPRPDFDAVRVNRCRSNLVVTEADPFMVTVQLVPSTESQPLQPAKREFDAGAAVSVIIVPTDPTDENKLKGLKDQIQAYLEPRRLLTTRVHVVGPIYLNVGIKITVFPLADYKGADVQKSVENALKTFLDPFHGGDDGTG